MCGQAGGGGRRGRDGVALFIPPLCPPLPTFAGGSAHAQLHQANRPSTAPCSHLSPPHLQVGQHPRFHIRHAPPPLHPVHTYPPPHTHTSRWVNTPASTSGKTPLHCAVRSGDPQTVNTLLELGADMYCRCGTLQYERGGGTLTHSPGSSCWTPSSITPLVSVESGEEVWKCGKMCWSVDVNYGCFSRPCPLPSPLGPSTTALLLACLRPLSFIRPSTCRPPPYAQFPPHGPPLTAPHPSTCFQHIAAILGKKDIAIMLLMHHVRYKRMDPIHTFEIDDRQKDIASMLIMANVRLLPAQSR